MRLVANLCLDLLGALPQPPIWIKAEGEVERGRKGKGQRKGMNPYNV